MPTLHGRARARLLVSLAMLLLLARAGGQGTPALAAAPKGQDGHVDLVGWRDPGSRIPRGDRQDGKNGPAAAALKAGFGVRSFPTLVIETPGSEPRTLVDYVAKDRVLQFLSGGRSPDVPIIK
jgi:hypothetical protein